MPKQLLKLTKEVKSHQLILAAANGNLDEVNSLLAGEYDPNYTDSDGDNALLAAVKSGRTKTVGALTKSGFDVNFKDKKGNTSLICATKLNYKKILNVLIANDGIMLDAKGKNGRTALYSAVDEGFTAAVGILAQAGADQDVVVEENLTPFLLAISLDFVNCFENLLESKPTKLDQKDHQGDTPLFAALKFESIKVFRRLVELGANLEIPDKHGDSPLMYAVRNNLTDFVKILLENNASINSKNKQKLLDLAPNDAMRNTIQTFVQTFRERLKRAHYVGEPPQDYLCPIDLELFDDPVTVSCGHTINRAPLTLLFYKPDVADPCKKAPCPCCREPISLKEIKNKSSVFIKNKLEEFVAQQEQIHADKKRIKTKKPGFFENPAKEEQDNTKVIKTELTTPQQN